MASLSESAPAEQPQPPESQLLQAEYHELVSPVTQPSSGGDAAVPHILQQGIPMLKVSAKKQKRYVFKLDPDQGQIVWESKKFRFSECGSLPFSLTRTASLSPPPPLPSQAKPIAYAPLPARSSDREHQGAPVRRGCTILQGAVPARAGVRGQMAHDRVHPGWRVQDAAPHRGDARDLPDVGHNAAPPVRDPSGTDERARERGHAAGAVGQAVLEGRGRGAGPTTRLCGRRAVVQEAEH